MCMYSPLKASTCGEPICPGKMSSSYSYKTLHKLFVKRENEMEWLHVISNICFVAQAHIAFYYKTMINNVKDTCIHTASESNKSNINRFIIII